MSRFCNVLLATGLAMSWTAGAATLGAAAAQDATKTPPASQAKQGQTGQPAAPAQPAPAYTPEEAQAFQAIQNELDPDRTAQLVGDYEKKFPNSKLMAGVCIKGAIAYQQKGDVKHVIEYGEKTLKLQNDNLLALLLVASVLPEPQSLQGNDLDKEKRLTEASEYSTHALQLIDQMPKQPSMTDDQFKQTKGSLSAMAHSALGLVHLQRAGMALTGPDKAELEKAQDEYKQAVTLSPRPEGNDYYRLGEAYAQGGKADDAIAAFSKASELSEGTALKKLADDQIETLKKSKAQPKPPPKP